MSRIRLLSITIILMLLSSNFAIAGEVLTSWDPKRAELPICAQPITDVACYQSTYLLPPKDDSSAGCTYGTSTFSPADIPAIGFIKSQSDLINLSNKRGYCDVYFRYTSSESLGFSTSGVSYIFIQSEKDQDKNDQHLCKSIKDESCSAMKWPGYQMKVNMNFWSCESKSDLGCVGSLEVISGSGVVTAANFVRYLPDTPKVLGESWQITDPNGMKSTLSFPTGGGFPVYSYFDSSTATTKYFMVQGLVERSYQNIQGEWKNPSATFSLGIYPVELIKGNGGAKPRAIEAKQDLGNGQTRTIVTTQTLSPGIPGCNNPLAKDENICANRIPFDDVRIRIALQIPDDATLFLQGRVNKPIAFTEKMDGGYRVTLEAGPGQDLAVAGNLNKSKFGPDILNALRSSGGPAMKGEDLLSRAPTDLPSSLLYNTQVFSAFLPYVGNRTSLVGYNWNLESSRTINRFLGSCVNSAKGQILGLVSTNATIYSPDPPQFDQSTQTISYEVAAPHFNSDGTTLATGHYFLNMNAKFMQCLLGVNKVPDVASLGITYSDGSESSVYTVSVRQDSDWLRMAADNFHFSTPKLQIKFEQPTNAPTIVPPSPKSATVSPNKITISCVKGKTIKKVVAVNPVCPKGYKKK